MRSQPRGSRGSGVLLVLVLAGTGGLGWGVSHATGADRRTPSSGPTTSAPTASPRVTPSATPAPTPTSTPTPTPTPTKPNPGLVRVLGPGDKGEQVREAQARLKQIGWYDGDVTGVYADRTATSVSGFQRKRGLTASGVLDRQTMSRLTAMTHEPTRGERYNEVGWSASAAGPLDARCRTGRVICIDKGSRTLRWVVDGQVRSAMAVRFGASYTPTREGTFSVRRKSRDHVSTLYHSAMPYSMFFSGGQAVHYSSDFAARGYAGASHGCVNVRDRAGIARLFDQVRVGDRVVIAG